VPEKEDRITIRLVAREGAPAETLHTVAGLLRLVSRIGGLGAKTQYGCGQFEVSDGEELDATADVDPRDRDFTLSAARFRCLRYSVSDQTMKAWELRPQLRRALRGELGVEASRVLGTLSYKDGKPRSSRVHISNLVPSATVANRREFKVWFDDLRPAEIQQMVEGELLRMDVEWQLDWSWQ
jgi:CRISPR/Cas system CMR-associated protein Cmr1 (group 7 of RAMP superfamily)